MPNLIKKVMDLPGEKVVAVVMVFVCISCAALAAGLTIGLVSLDKNELSLVLINGSTEEKRQAKAILPIIKDHHWLLVTLFLFNAAANETLPLFLGDLMPRFVSVIVATFTVLMFGEIIPSSVFSGPNQMKIAASLSGVVYLLLAIFYPVARPIGLFLDWWLGKHEAMDATQAPFNAKDLYTLLSMARRDPLPGEAHGDDIEGYGSMQRISRNTSRASSRMGSRRGSFRGEGDGGDDDNELLSGEFAALIEHQAPELLASADETDKNLLEHDVVTIAQGAIVCSRIFVDAIMQPKFYTLDADREVTVQLFEDIGAEGFSRIPVNSKGTLLGYIVVKELLCKLSYYISIANESSLGNASPLLVRDLPMHSVVYCAPSMTVLNALNKLQTGDRRIGVVTKDGTAFGDVLGYFTLEDVMEEIIQEEIDDEKDTSAVGKAKRLAAFYGLVGQS